MKAKDALIAWTPMYWHRHNPGQVSVGPLPSKDEPDWSAGFAMTGGAAYTARRKLTGDASRAAVFIDFQTLVVRDGLDPMTVHKAFLAIDEYREALAPDCLGADEG